MAALRQADGGKPNSRLKARHELTVHTTNQRAIEAYKRCGFRVEGVRQSSLLVDGKYVDEYLEPAKIGRWLRAAT